ncbi:MAG: alpha-L-fucosidase [Candidatus Merdivicinus sp.]|jgi:alpha-L-fucosidase
MNNQNLVELQKWFVNLRLGQFIHFNSATAQFHNTNIEDWEYGHENRGMERKYPFDPATWNPQKLDCYQWAAASKSMGAKFAALTAKHHEGFCIWNTRTTEHCIRNATCKRDVVAEYLKAYREAGISAGLYFSMLDLTHEIGRKKCTPEDVEFTKEQLRELLTNYGEIPFLIIDGWQARWGGPFYEKMPFEEIDDFVKSLQPNCLLINHSCETSLAHSDIVFYENAAGQEVPDGFMGPGAAGNKLTNNWFWHDTDATTTLKPAQWALEKAMEMNSRNVAFLINASPNDQGLLDENMIARFAKIGAGWQQPEKLTELPENWLVRE